MSEERVREALRALRKADSGVTTAPEAEIRTLLKFRRQCRQRRLQRIAMWSATAAAALVLAIPHWRTRQDPAPAVATVVPSAAPDSTSIVVPAATQVPLKQVASDPEEATTDFFPLVVSAPPFEHGLLVRVTVTAEAMRAVGLPVSDEHLSDPVEADVLVGQDDLARAIRFVNYRN